MNFSTNSSLPSPGEPLRLSDGTLIDVGTGRKIDSTTQVSSASPEPAHVGQHRQGMIPVPRHSDWQRQATSVRRRLSDLPDSADRMNVVSVVLAYMLWGLSDKEIATALSLSEEQVGRVKMLDAFSQMYEGVIEGIKQRDADDVRNMISRGAKSAAQTMLDLAAPGMHPSIRIQAAKDILDRDGHRPADVVEHRHRIDGGLTIEVLKRGGTEDVPGITIEYPKEDS